MKWVVNEQIIVSGDNAPHTAVKRCFEHSVIFWIATNFDLLRNGNQFSLSDQRPKKHCSFFVGNKSVELGTPQHNGVRIKDEAIHSS
jgi:hypothetical protein